MTVASRIKLFLLLKCGDVMETKYTFVLYALKNVNVELFINKLSHKLI